MINTQAKSTLAKLLAKENIEVRQGNYQTAAFDVENRVLMLPLWKDMGKDVYDLLVGHEVGHALFTPSEGWHDSKHNVEGIPRSYLNIIEDIRIERAIQTQYPGLVASFKRGYKVLFDQDFFGTAERPTASYKLPDRINIKAKLADLAEVPFTEEEAPLVKQCFTVSTWEEVVEAARALYNYMAENEETADDEQNDEETSFSDGMGDSPSGDNNDDGGSQDETQSDSQDSEPQDNNGFDEFEDNTQGSGSEGETDKESVEDKVVGRAGGDTTIETDQVFRSKESSLLEDVGNGYQPLYVRAITSSDARKAVHTYKDVFKSREESYARYTELEKFPVEECNEAFDAFLTENDRVVKTMVKEFEMRKAAFRYSRATTSKTGTLDTLKMHSYKYNEDIFARATKLADAKNHGMVMLVDYSGSMQDTLPQIQRQVIVLSMFCRKVNIPFKVYGFTSGGNGKTFDTNLILEGLKMFELFSNEMSKSEFNKAVYQVFAQSWEMQNRTYFRVYTAYMSQLEGLGGTPLNEALLVLHKIIPEFKTRHSLDKVNFICLTDGSANNMHVDREVGDTRMVAYNKVSVQVGKKRITLVSRQCTDILINEMREQYGVTTIGYFIPQDGYDFRNESYRCGLTSEEDIRARRREFNKQKFTMFDDVLGYDRYFLLRSGRDIDTATAEFDVMEGAKKGELTRQFKKFAGSKKGNRVLATKFAEMVA